MRWSREPAKVDAALWALAIALRLLEAFRGLRGGSYFPPLIRAKITLPGTGSSGYLPGLTPRLFCNRNLTDEAPLFSEDPNFDSKIHTLTANFGHPSTLKFTNNESFFIVTIALPEGATLDDPEQVENALHKLYSRVKYYTNLTSV
jgi:hypothetical protein